MSIMQFILISYIRHTNSYGSSVFEALEGIVFNPNFTSFEIKHYEEKLLKIFPQDEIDKAFNKVIEVLRLIDIHGRDFLLGHAYAGGPSSLYGPLLDTLVYQIDENGR